MGVSLALTALLLFGVGLVNADPMLGVVGSVVGLAGASLIAWGWSARRRRREALLRALERILFSLDDGSRVRS